MKWIKPVIASVAVVAFAGCDSSDSQSTTGPSTNSLSEQATMPEQPVVTAAPTPPAMESTPATASAPAPATN